MSYIDIYRQRTPAAEDLGLFAPTMALHVLRQLSISILAYMLLLVGVIGNSAVNQTGIVAMVDTPAKLQRAVIDGVRHIVVTKHLDMRQGPSFAETSGKATLAASVMLAMEKRSWGAYVDHPGALLMQAHAVAVHARACTRSWSNLSVNVVQVFVLHEENEGGPAPPRMANSTTYERKVSHFLWLTGFQQEGLAVFNKKSLTAVRCFSIVFIPFKL